MSGPLSVSERKALKKAYKNLNLMDATQEEKGRVMYSILQSPEILEKLVNMQASEKGVGGMSDRGHIEFDPEVALDECRKERLGILGKALYGKDFDVEELLRQQEVGYKPDSAHFGNITDNVIFGPNGKLLEGSGRAVKSGLVGVAASLLFAAIAPSFIPPNALANPSNSPVIRPDHSTLNLNDYIVAPNYKAVILSWMLAQNVVTEEKDVSTVRNLLDFFNANQEARDHAQIRFDYDKREDVLNILILPDKNNPDVGFAYAIGGERNDGVLEQLLQGKLPTVKKPEVAEPDTTGLGEIEGTPAGTITKPGGRIITPESQHLIWASGGKGQGSIGAKIGVPNDLTLLSEVGLGKERLDYSLAAKFDMSKILQAYISLKGIDLKKSGDKEVLAALVAKRVNGPYFSVSVKGHSTQAIEGATGLDKGEVYSFSLGPLFDNFAFISGYDKTRRNGQTLEEGGRATLAINMSPGTLADYLLYSQNKPFAEIAALEKDQEGVGLILGFGGSHTRSTNSSLKSQETKVYLVSKIGQSTIGVNYELRNSTDRPRIKLPTGSVLLGEEIDMSNRRMGVYIAQKLGDTPFYVRLGGKMDIVRVNGVEKQDRGVSFTLIKSIGGASK